MVDKLVQALKALLEHPELDLMRTHERWSESDIPERAWIAPPNADEVELPEDLTALYHAVVDQANGVLITSDGQPNYPAMQLLEPHGWRVTKGESDSFGWLSGIIRTPKGRIVYG